MIHQKTPFLLLGLRDNGYERVMNDPIAPLDLSNRDLSSRDAFTLQIAEIQPRLYGFILKRLADREQTLEVLQQTNLTLCHKSDDFVQGSSFTAWAFTIAKFQIMAWRTSQKRSRLVFSDEILHRIDRSSETESLAVDQRISPLRKCLKALRDKDRMLIQSRYRDGESLCAIAQSTSKTLDAVGMKLSRIRRQLADCVHRKLQQEAGV